MRQTGDDEIDVNIFHGLGDVWCSEAFFQIHNVVHVDLIGHEELPDGKMEVLNAGAFQEMRQGDLRHMVSTTRNQAGEMAYQCLRGLIWPWRVDGYG